MDYKYQFERLGGIRFQDLVNSILRRQYGSSLTSFRAGADEGADGVVTLDDGQLVIQSKFTSKALSEESKVFSRLRSVFSAELGKSAVADPKTKQYLFVTNYSLTKSQHDELTVIFRGVHPEKKLLINSRSDLNSFLDSYPDIPSAYPEILTFSQLHHLVNASTAVKEREYLRLLLADTDLFISTSIFRKALSILDQNNFVLLSGAPKVGKTFNAEALGRHYAEQGYRVFSAVTPEDFFDATAMSERVLVICDDVFGDIELKSEKSDRWIERTRLLLSGLNESKKLIWTTRNYILAEAIDRSKLSELEAKFKRQMLEVDLDEVTNLEKAHIIQRHFVKANLSEAERDLLVSISPAIVKHPKFSPEAVRQLSSGDFKRIFVSEKIKNRSDALRLVYSFFDEPLLAWKKAFANLSAAEQIILKGLVVLADPISLDSLAKFYHSHTSDSRTSFQKVISKLEGGFIKRKVGYSEAYVAFHHPSIKDLVIAAINDNAGERTRIIDDLSFHGVKRILLAGVAGVSYYVTDRSDLHRLKFDSEPERKMLKQRFGVLLPNSSLNDFTSTMKALEGNALFAKIYEDNKRVCVSSDFYELHREEPISAWASYLTFVEGLISSDPTVGPPTFVGELYSKLTNAPKVNESFWKCLKAFKVLFPVHAKILIKCLDTTAIESELLDAINSHVECKPSTEPKTEREWEAIPDFIDDTRSLRELCAVVNSSLALDQGNDALSIAIEDLENCTDGLDDPRYRMDYDHDSFKEERAERVYDEDRAITDIVRGEEESEE